ncbi:hypothetical protein DFS34DRAFT_582946, partial [Phlyctochytrium arcticum]
FRLFRRDGTFATISCREHTTAGELLVIMAKKSLISDFSKFNIVMVRRGMERILGRAERPLIIQRRLFEQVGYTPSDRIELLGREDHSYLVRFVFKEISTGQEIHPDYWRSPAFRKSVVSVANSNISNIPVALFHFANEIKQLDLSRNLNIQDLPNDLAQAMDSLQILSMSRNEICKVPKSLRLLRTLSDIDLSYNRISTLEGAGFEVLAGLTKLKLAGNFIDRIPEDIPRACQQLQYLDLSNNRLRSFPMDLCRYNGQSLKYLNLSFCRIKAKIPDAVGELRNLVVLKLTGNRMYGGLPWKFGELQELRELDLRGNSFGNSGGEELMVMEVLCRCRKLDTLRLDANRIRWFSLSFQYDNYDRPMLCRISNLSGTLTELDLSYSGIEFLPKRFFQRLPGLLSLNLSGNRLRELPEIMATSTKQDAVPLPLRELFVSNNVLESLPADIGDLAKLVYLDAKRNYLRTLPTSIWRCKSLKVLNLTSNRLEVFPSPLPEDGTVLVSGFNSTFSRGQPTYGFTLDRSAPSNYTVTRRMSHKVDEAMLASQLQQSSQQVTLPPLSHVLESLYLSDNYLGDDLYMALYHLPNLLILHTSFNDITDITPWVVAIPLPVPMTPWFQKLQELHLSGNLIGTLPGEIERMRSLRMLFLNGNKLSTVPGEVGKLKSLEGLDLGSQVGGRGEGTGLRYNVSNWPYDWNWNWNLDLRYLNLSGNKRLEIKPSATAARFLSGPEAMPPGNAPNPAAGHKRRRDLTDFNALSNLRLLGLMDVTCLIVPPDESADRRVRTTGSEVPIVGIPGGSVRYGVADSEPDAFDVWDLVIPKFRGRDNEALFGVFDGRGTPGGAKMAKYLNEWFHWFLANELEKIGKGAESGPSLPGTINRERHSEGNQAPSHKFLHGASAMVVFLLGRPAGRRTNAKCTLYIANVGDGMVVMSKAGGLAEVLAQHHALDLVDGPLLEMERVQNAGDWFSNDIKVEGELDVTKAIGYFPFLGAVNAEPWIRHVDLELTEDEDGSLTLGADHDRSNSEPSGDVTQPEPTPAIVAGGGWGTAAMKVRDVALSLSGGRVPGGYLVMVLGLRDLAKKSAWWNARRGSAESSSESLMVDDRSRRGDVISMKDKKKRGMEESADAVTLRYLQIIKEITPPTGRLALVFTDIKNSTSIWENNPVAMRAALRLHHQVMRRLLRQTGGYEVKTEGDAFMVSFQNVASAAEWCLTVQGELLSIDWPSEILSMGDGSDIYFQKNGPSEFKRDLIFKGLSVRMGIHFGTPLCEVDPITSRMDYYGPMVNRAARVTGASQGGQILISSDAMKELQKALGWWGDDSDVSLQENVQSGKDLTDFIGMKGEDALNDEVARLKRLGIVTWCIGEVKLKGLETPEVIYAIYRRELLMRHRFFALEQSGGLDLNAQPQRKADEELSQEKLIKVDKALVQSLASICLRLEWLAARCSESWRDDDGSSSRGDGDYSSSSSFPATPLEDNEGEWAVEGIEDSDRAGLIRSMEGINAASILYLTRSPFSRVLQSLGAAIETDPNHLLRALQLYAEELDERKRRKSLQREHRREEKERAAAARRERRERDRDRDKDKDRERDRDRDRDKDRDRSERRHRSQKDSSSRDDRDKERKQ